MIFASPHLLYLLIPLFIICLLGAFVKIKFKAQIKYPLAKGLKVKTSPLFLLASWLPFLLVVVALILLIFAICKKCQNKKFCKYTCKTLQ